MDNHIFKIHISSGNLNNICSIPQSEKRKTIKKKNLFFHIHEKLSGEMVNCLAVFLKTSKALSTIIKELIQIGHHPTILQDCYYCLSVSLYFNKLF